MDAMEQVRIAGTIVDILTAMGCSAEDIRAITDAVNKHLSLQAKEPLTLNVSQTASLIGLHN